MALRVTKHATRAQQQQQPAGRTHLAVPLPAHARCGLAPQIGARRCVAAGSAAFNASVSATTTTLPRSAPAAAPPLPKPAASPAAPEPTNVTTWRARVYLWPTSTSPPTAGAAPQGLVFYAVDRETGAKSAPIDISGWTPALWTPERELPGTVVYGDIKLDKSVFGTSPPGALVFKTQEQLYMSEIKLTDAATSGPEVVFSGNTYVFPEQNERIFFSDTCLVANTPEGLKALRSGELKGLRGETGTSKADDRKPYDRVYEYQPYDDLGAEGEDRPTLGIVHAGDKFPYPRRIRGKKEGGKPWTPKDDAFDADKASGFQKEGVLSIISAANNVVLVKHGILRTLPALLWSVLRNPFSSVLPGAATKFLDKVAAEWSHLPFENLQEIDDLYAGKGFVEKVLGFVTVLLPPPLFKLQQKKLQQLSSFIDYNVPACYATAGCVDGVRSKEAWKSDEDWGRQYLAGVNPMVLTVMTKKSLDASMITESTLTAHLGGLSLDQALDSSTPRLFIVDYWDALASAIDEVNKQPGSVLHAGRAVLFRRDDGHLVPIAIELGTNRKGQDAHAIVTGVYTPSDAPSVWLTAKAIFQSLDAGVHQLISHWLRCHACTEPYLIALRRQLSAMHPVYRLLLPHFRYTAEINANARSSLINAGGVIETCFTPGKHSLSLSSTLYGLTWRFDQQSLPADLKARGFLDAKGALNVEDYPYAQDGLLIWNALEKYFGDYLALYYSSEQDIAEDSELQGWWNEVKTKGHPDVDKSTWPALKTVGDLTQILSTIAWVTSAHHAAVNFGQYDFSAYMPNHSSSVRRHMPVQGTEEYESLAKLDVASSEFEKELLTFTADKLSSAKVMSTVALLAAHADDEQYLTDVNEWITEPRARKAMGRFISDIQAAQREIQARNLDPALKARSTFPGGYTLLIPDSPQSGLTSRGVPFSISI